MQKQEPWFGGNGSYVTHKFQSEVTCSQYDTGFEREFITSD